jgi:glycosyltransferase involved in cell wall biosynthesis
MPLVEAMAFDIPVIAYAATAVPETIGNAGTQIDTWDDQHVAGLVHAIHDDHTQKEQLLAKQRKNLERFTSEEAKTRLRAAIQFLQSGVPDSVMEAVKAV